MAVIQNAIGTRAFELIRDRIGSILADELPNQATLTGDTLINATVFIERFVPPSDEEMPMVNVSLAKGDYGLMTALTQDGTYIYHVDIHTKSKSNASGRGDSLSFVQLHKLAGICHAILSDSRYRTLGFERPFIEHVEVSSLEFASPLNAKDASSVVMGRLTVSVRVPENVESLQGVLIAGYDTTVEIGITSQGYVFSGNTAPIPPPVCNPATITDSDGISAFQVASGGTGTCTPKSKDIFLKAIFYAGDDTMATLTIDADNAGVYTSITDDGGSGIITLNINGAGFAAFTSPTTLSAGDTLIIKRTIATNSGFVKLTGTY